MPEFDLSTLSGAELRGLLDSSRQRGHARQAYQILQEMESRRSRERRAPARSERRTIEVDLGDPLRFDEDEERPPAREAAEPAPAEPPLVLEPAARPQPREPRPQRPPPRRWRGLGFVAGLALGTVVGFGLAYEQFGSPGPERSLAPFPEAPALRVETASPPPSPAPPMPTTPIPTTPAPLAPAAPATAELPPATPSQPEAAALVQSEPSKAEPAAAEPAAAEEAKARPAKAPSTDCAQAPTPADRTICADDELKRLQRELRRAYARALDAHPDRAGLRTRQLAWRDARNPVTDPGELAKLYKSRIRQLALIAREAEGLGDGAE